jgi:hypothetical protein
MADDVLTKLKEFAESGIGGDAAKSVQTVIDEITKIGPASVSAADAQKKLEAAMGGLGDQFKKFISGASAVAIATSGISVAGITATDVVNKLKTVFSGASDQAEKFGVNLTTTGIKAILMLEPATKILSNVRDSFGAMGEQGTLAGSQISDSFAALEPILGKLPLFGLVSGMGAIADQSRNLERNLLGVAAASGDLDALMDQAGEGFKDMTDVTATFSKYTFESAQATGMSFEAMSNYGMQLLKIPGAIRETVAVGDRLGGTMNMLTASTTVAASYGMKFGEVVEQLNWAYRQLNLQGADALKVIAQMGELSKELKIPMSDVTGFVQTAAKGFKMYGDNVRAATQVMRVFGGAFKESGLGPEAITELVSNMTSGIQKMDVAHKAFVSSASGGPGGLAGAYEIEYALKTGDMDKVMEKTMTAMQKQFGGPVLTLEDVNRTPALAGEFFKQVSFLRDVAGMAGNDAEAYKILEAMKRGEPAKLAEVTTTPEEAMQASMERGVDIQRRHTDILTSSRNYLQYISAVQALMLDEQRRKLFGAESAIFGEGQRKLMMDAVREGAKFGGMGAVPGKTFDLEDALLDIPKQGKNFAGVITDGSAKFKGAITDYIDKTKIAAGSFEKSRREEETAKKETAAAVGIGAAPTPKPKAPEKKPEEGALTPPKAPPEIILTPPKTPEKIEKPEKPEEALAPKMPEKPKTPEAALASPKGPGKPEVALAPPPKAPLEKPEIAPITKPETWLEYKSRNLRLAELAPVPPVAGPEKLRPPEVPMAPAMAAATAAPPGAVGPEIPTTPEPQKVLIELKLVDDAKKLFSSNVIQNNIGGGAA